MMSLSNGTRSTGAGSCTGDDHSYLVVNEERGPRLDEILAERNRGLTAELEKWAAERCEVERKLELARRGMAGHGQARHGPAGLGEAWLGGGKARATQ